MLLGGGVLTVVWDGVMVGENDAKFGEKKNFGSLAVVNKKGEEA